MSELAYSLNERKVFTETTGNITRLFFAPEQAEAATPAAPYVDFPVQAEPTQPDQESQSHLTSRQKELAKPNSKDMATQPLESYAQLHDLISYFENRRKYREACLLVFGFCTGLRISDLLSLKLGDVVESLNPITFKRAIDIREQKTGKRTVGHLDDMLITPAMQQYFTQYMEHKSHWEKDDLDYYLFTACSRPQLAMTIRAIQISLAPAFKAICPGLHCSTHTMRKTFCSIIHVFSSQSQMSGAGLNPSTACQIALRHANASTTLAYMGTMKAGMLSLRQAVSDFVLGRTKIKSLVTEYQWELCDD